MSYGGEEMKIVPGFMFYTLDFVRGVRTMSDAELHAIERGWLEYVWK
jgi:hypothetical protein